METLSKEAEQEIIDAARSAVDMVDNHSMSPTDAVEKLARDHSFQPDKIRFLSHAYNTGRQTAQRESTDNALDKFAEFPLADGEDVIDRIWPKKVKTASDIAYEGVSSEYGQRPGWLSDRQARQKQAILKQASARLEPLIKQAASNCKECGQPMKQCKCSEKMSLDKAIDVGMRLKTATEQARHEAAVAYETLMSRMGKLGDYFHKFARDREDFAYVDLAAKTYFGVHGTALMDWVYSRNKMARDKTARAADLPVKYASNRMIDWTSQPWNHISACIELARTVNEKRAAEGAARDTLLKHANEVLRPFVSAPQTSLTSWSLLPLEGGAAIVKQSSMGFLADTTMMGQQTKALLDKALGGTNDAVDSKWEELEDPQHDAKLRQIRTQSMLAELMNDDVIGSHDPETVMQKYNEISQLAPRAASQPAVVRSMLRRHLQGDVQPFEHNESLNIEKGLKDSSNTTPDSLTPGLPKPKPAQKTGEDTYSLLTCDADNIIANFNS